MPKFLPTKQLTIDNEQLTKKKLSNLKCQISNAFGFTLIELLVVVSIIAVLSVMGIVVLGSVQKGARDARRKADIQAISKALEVNYNDASGQYVPLTGAMFAGNSIPKDPMQGTNCGTPEGSSLHMCRYCVLDTPGNCLGIATNNNVSTTMPGGGTPYTTYTICANLENGTGTSSYYCLSNQR